MVTDYKLIQNDFCEDASNKECATNICRSFLIISLVILGSNNKEILKNNKGSKYLTLSGNTVCILSKEFKNYSVFSEGLTTFGNVPFVHTGFKLTDNFGNKIYQLESDLPLNSDQQGITFSRAITGLCFNKLKNADIKIITGVNSYFSYDINHGFRGGWYRENYRTYLGNGNIQNVQNIPILLNGIGIQFKYNTKNVSLYGDIINDNNNSSKTTDTSNGFLGNGNSNTNLFECGLSYKTFFKSIFNFHFQKLICGNKSVLNDYPSLTKNASNNLIKSMQNNNGLESYSVLNVSPLKKNIEVSGAFSCINTKKKNKDGRLLMWSLGLLSRCKKFKCFSNIIPHISYGINIATPLYVQKSIMDENVTDGKPYVFEVNLSTNIDAFIIPIFWNIIKLPDEPNKPQSLTSFIVGCRPYYVLDDPQDRIWNSNCNCPVEGSI